MQTASFFSENLFVLGPPKLEKMCDQPKCNSCCPPKCSRSLQGEPWNVGWVRRVLAASFACFVSLGFIPSQSPLKDVFMDTEL